MTTEEAIKILEDMKVNFPVPKAAVTQTKRNIALDMAVDALSNSSESPNGWIPCTPETMPKEGILVWVSMGNEVALWRRYNSDWYQDGLTSRVIPVEETEAWMPIEVPEPYQSKEDES